MEKDKTNSRKIKAVETKKRIYESAVKLIKIHGLDNLSVDSIVETAGVSKGAFYVHFESKFSLIAEYVSTLDLNYEEYFASLPPDKKPSELLILFTERVTDTIIDSIGIELIKNIYEAQLKRTVETSFQLSYNRKIYQIYRRIISKGVQQGDFRAAIDIDSTANHCVISIRGLTYEWCIRYPDFNLKEEVLKHFDILLTGIKIAP